MNAAVFHVLTEFRFDIGAALLGSDTLQGRLNQLSASALDAQNAIMRVGVGFLGSMGLGTTSVLGSLWTMIEASEKFNASQRSLANILKSNHMVLNIEDGLLAAEDAMDRIRHKAVEFGLPANTMLQTTKMLAATLAAMPAVPQIQSGEIKINKIQTVDFANPAIPAPPPLKFALPAFPKVKTESNNTNSGGLEDVSLSRSIDLARFYLKAAPILGVDPGAYYNQLVDLVMGRGTNNDMFTQRLFADTQALAPYKMQGGMQKFNQLDSDKRIKVLTEALSQFGSESKIVEMNARSLTAQIQVLKDQIYGAFSVFREIGSSLSDIVGQAVYQANIILSTHGGKISRQLSDFIKSVAKSPEEAWVKFREVQDLKSDVKSASHILETVGMIGALGSALKFFGIIAKPFGAWVSVVASVVVALIDIIFFRSASVLVKQLLFIGTGIAVLIAVLKFPIVGTILATGAALTWFFSIFTKAKALAEVDDFKKTPQQLENFTRNVNALRISLGRIAQPFNAIKDFIAEHIKWMFTEAGWYNFINQQMFDFVYGLSIVEMFIGAILKIPEAIAAAMQYFTSTEMLSNPRGIAKAFMGPIDDIQKKIWDENMAPYNDPKKTPVSQQITNVGNININNQFKEQMEPDRIAFTLMEQIKKTAANPGQARNGTLSMAYAGGR